MSRHGDRPEVLRRVRSVVGDRYEDRRIESRIVFCPGCGDDITAGNGSPGQAIACPDPRCGFAGNRALIFDQKTLWLFNNGDFDDVPPGDLVHFSVGVKIRRGDRFLLFRRTLFPIGQYTIPAGHLEAGETPQQSAIREAYEETGLGILSCEPAVDRKALYDPCRRGADYHVWNLYTCESIGEPRMSYEADIMGWYQPDEIANLPLTIATKAFFEVHPERR